MWNKSVGNDNSCADYDNVMGATIIYLNLCPKYDGINLFSDKNGKLW